MPSAKRHPNLETIKKAVQRLGSLAQQAVLLGGSSTELFLTDAGAPPTRKSEDIDIIVRLATRGDYYAFSEKLRARGFSEDKTPGAPLCRWRSEDGIVLDVMPTNQKILGFGNRWYGPALSTSETVDLADGPSEPLKIKIVSPPYFLATKLEAFDGRGKGDYFGSHDMEDIIALIDGRPEIIDEIAKAPKDLRDYLRKRFGKLLKSNKFLDAIPGHLPPDPASQARFSLILKRIEAIAHVKK